MKLDPRMRSRNVEDRRGRRGGGRAVARGGGLVAVALLVASIFFPEAVPILQMIAGGSSPQQTERAAPLNDEMNEFVAVTLGYTEDFWEEAFRNGAFPAAGRQYQPARLVLFTDGVSTRCGAASSASGPFYCP
ncbi:MAG: neutral zinc metallopeptidase, partial [Pseudomonadota bacterium]